MAQVHEAKIDAAKADAVAEQAYAAAAAATPVKAPAQTEAAQPAPVAQKRAAKPAVKKTVKKAAAAAKPAARKTAAAQPAPSFKDTIMAKTQNVTEDFTAKVKDAMTQVQDRAKVAFEKSQAFAGEAGEFTKGNVEALVESGKVLAAGLQDMGKDYATEAKSAFDTVQADFKALAAVQSPTDFFKLQGEILRRNFDAAVATGSKNSEKAVKLANEAFAPIQNRVSLAIEKVKQAA